MKTTLLAAAFAAVVLASPARAWDDNFDMQAAQQRMELQQQMDSNADAVNQRQQQIYNQSLQMRAGGCWYNHSQPYC